MTKSIVKFTILFTGFYALFIFGLNASAFVRGSDNYRIQSDSINSGGTDESFSDSYKAWDTVGEVGTGDSASDSYKINAGYRQMESNYISMTVGSSSMRMLPSLSGLAGGTANASGTWIVATDAIAGYSLRIRATSTPALQSPLAAFADYSPAVDGTPDYDWNIESANSEFGFSPYNPLSQAAKYKNNGSNACNSGNYVTAGKCWNKFTTSDETVTYKTSRTDPAGEENRIDFRAEINTSGGMQEAGEYMATIVVTAVVN